MEVLRAVLLTVLAGAALVGWRRYRYPGGWAFGFSPRHTADRRGLAGPRRRLRRLRWRASREMAAAHVRVGLAQARHRSRVRAAERRLDRLRRPGRGEQVSRLGGLVLHRHVLLDGGEEIPLAGLRVRFESGQDQHHLYLTRPGDKVRYTSYPHTSHDEEEIRRFAVAAENAAVAEDAFLARRQEETAEAEEALRRIRADTARPDRARRRRDQVTERQRADTRIKAARADVEEARDRWQALTGRRPHRFRADRRSPR